MKNKFTIMINKYTVLITIMMIVVALSDYVFAFHEGGVGYCEGCHKMHGSSKEDVQDSHQMINEGAGNYYMLKGSDPSSTCLKCHAEEGAYYSVLSKHGSQYTPGGDFYWLKKTFTSTVAGKLYKSEGDNHGHNIVAVDYGLTADNRMTSAVGGVYPSSAMACTACHNPHGTRGGNSLNRGTVSVSGSYGEIAPEGTIAGNYRLLGGTGYNGGNLAGVNFTYPAPIAVTNPENWTETDANHPAYGTGMSEWCGNCHNALINSDRKHPSGDNAKLSSTVISNYNSYVKTGNIAGTQANSYTALIPFELGTSDKSLLDPSSSAGPDMNGKANVMCLTCHRVHASAFQDIGRWDFQATYIADSHPQNGDSGVTGDDVINSYYGRDMIAEFGKYQRQLCNKCHMQD